MMYKVFFIKNCLFLCKCCIVIVLWYKKYIHYRSTQCISWTAFDRRTFTSRQNSQGRSDIQEMIQSTQTTGHSLNLDLELCSCKLETIKSLWINCGISGYQYGRGPGSTPFFILQTWWASPIMQRETVVTKCGKGNSLNLNFPELDLTSIRDLGRLVSYVQGLKLHMK